MSRSASPAMESLERRTFCAAQVTSIISDNRGEVLVTLNHAMNPSTINGRSVQMHVPGPDDRFGTADDVKIYGRVKYSAGAKRIQFLTDQLPVNSAYSFKVSGKLAKSDDGVRLDGEFNGPGLVSGNGEGGGDLLFISKRSKTAPVARFTTAAGSINVNLFKSQAPKTVDNFLTYADSGAWDGTFIHRVIPNYIVQGGGYKVNSSNNVIDNVENPPVLNEDGISNTRGTIAMAKIPDQPNSATNEWFFNLNNNGGTPPNGLDYENGGFTVFGQIANAGGLTVMDALGAFPVRDASAKHSALEDVPVQNGAAYDLRGTLDPAADLLFIRRVAILNKVSTFIIG